MTKYQKVKVVVLKDEPQPPKTVRVEVRHETIRLAAPYTVTHETVRIPTPYTVIKPEREEAMTTPEERKEIRKAIAQRTIAKKAPQIIAKTLEISSRYELSSKSRSKMVASSLEMLLGFFKGDADAMYSAIEDYRAKQTKA